MAALFVGLLAACGNTAKNAVPRPVEPAGTAGAAGSAGGPSLPRPELQAVPGDMHRLNAFEYAATVKDVLGATAPSLTALRGGEVNGFDNNAAVLGMDETSFQVLYDSARQIAKSTLADPVLRAAVVTCTAQDATCAEELIQNAGLKLFRRPLSDEEAAVYRKLYGKLRAQLAHDAALEQVLVALLSSAQFLYRMEFPTQAEAEPLDPYELSSRLSYLLWSSAPDAALLEDARLDRVSSDADLELVFARAWDDARSARFVESFAGQWFGARRLLEHVVSPEVYPAWTPQVAAAAAREVYESFDATLRDNRDFSQFYVGAAHEIDGLLAPFYGLPAAAGARVWLDGERSGFLGSVAFFTLTSNDRRSSWVHRGKFVLERLACEPLPPPPPVVPPLDLEDPNLPKTPREYSEKLRASPSCVQCHALMDPIGLALEHYDGIGRYREVYDDGAPIDTSVLLQPWPGHPEALPADGIAGVTERVLSDANHERCVAEKLYHYTIGGDQPKLDEPNIAALTQRWQAGPRNFKALARELVMSKTFRYKLAKTVNP